LASYLGNGPVSWLNVAFRFMQLPIGLFGVALGTVTLPLVSRHVARGDRAALRRTLAESLELVGLLCLPAAAGLALFAVPVIGLIYEHGRFTAADTTAAAQALAAYTAGLAGYAGIKVLAPAFYALDDARTPMLVSLVSIAVNYALNWTFVRRLGFGHVGLALSTSAVALGNFGLLYLVLRRRIGALGGRLRAALARIAVATAVMAAVAGGLDVVVAAHLPAAGAPRHALAHGDLEPRLRRPLLEDPDLGGQGLPVLEVHPAPHAGERLLARRTPHLRVVDARDAAPGVEECGGEAAIVRQEQQAGRVHVEPPDRVEPALDAPEQRPDSRPALRVVERRDDPPRLVHDDRAPRPRRLLATHDTDQAPLEQGREHGFRLDAADRLDLGARARLAIRDDRHRLEHGAREAWRPLVQQAAHPGRVLGGRAELVAAPHLHEPDPSTLALVALGEDLERCRHLPPLGPVEGLDQPGKRHRRPGRKEQA